MAHQHPEVPAFARFDDAYLGTPPWEIGRPQPALAALFDSDEVSGRVLDVGCGTAELALLAASRGLDTTGVDSSPRAIAIARDRAAARGITTIRLEVGDALDLSVLGARSTPCSTAACSTSSRMRAVRATRSSSTTSWFPAAAITCSVFSDAQPGDWGPRRVSRAELDAAFERGWELREVVAATFEVNLEVGTVAAWRATVVRT